MWVRVEDRDGGGRDYTNIRNLRFEPETDVIGDTVPVNELLVSIATDDFIETGFRISLFDDLGTLWASYWVVSVERENRYYMRVKGQSSLVLLDNVTMDPVMYEGISVRDALASISERIPLDVYNLDESFDSRTLTGFCPKQSARERLQWICMVIGAYIKDYFGSSMSILPLETEETVIPIGKTFWKPNVSYEDYVSAVRVTYYSYVERMPSRTEEYVEAGGKVYVEQATTVTLANPETPNLASAFENVIEISDVRLINQRNVDEILSHLSTYYFKRTQVELDAINNAEFMPGQRVIAFADEDLSLVGYISSCSFSFGMQARSSITIKAAEDRECAKVTVTCMWGDVQIRSIPYTLPVGYEYDIEIPYIDITFSGHRYVFRPERDSVSGTVMSGGNTHTVQAKVVLDYNEGDLSIYAVDELSMVDGSAVIK